MAQLVLSAMEGSILALLEQHESLAFEQILAQLGGSADAVRNTLTDLRDSGFASVLSVGGLEAHTTKPASYWRLTNEGRRELARRRSD